MSTTRTSTTSTTRTSPTPASPTSASPTSREVGQPPAGRSRGARWIWALAVLVLVVAAALTWFVARPAYEQAQERESDAAAVAAARAMAVNFTTLDYQQFGPYKQRILDAATGQFAQDFAQQASSLQTLVTQNKSTSRPTRTEVALVSADADSAEVLAGIVAQTTNSAAPDGVTKTYRMDLKLEKAHGTWKVSSLEYAL